MTLVASCTLVIGAIAILFSERYVAPGPYTSTMVWNKYDGREVQQNLRSRE
jgi:hypothetical protein